MSGEARRAASDRESTRDSDAPAAVLHQQCKEEAA
jgi:hypothetical protein